VETFAGGDGTPGCTLAAIFEQEVATEAIEFTETFGVKHLVLVLMLKRCGADLVSHVLSRLTTHWRSHRRKLIDFDHQQLLRKQTATPS
jgi:hypothetical protein